MLEIDDAVAISKVSVPVGDTNVVFPKSEDPSIKIL